MNFDLRSPESTLLHELERTAKSGAVSDVDMRAADLGGKCGYFGGNRSFFRGRIVVSRQKMKVVIEWSGKTYHLVMWECM